MTTQVEVFSPEMHLFISLMAEVTNSCRVCRYKFMTPKEYEGLIRKSIPEGMRVYWTEILQRIYIASIAGLLRQKGWIDGVLLSAEKENYLSFAANLRGFLESSADLYDSLSSSALALARAYGEIVSAVTGVLQTPLLSREFEGQLIHFLYGRALPKRHEFPESHKAKHMRDYISAIQGAETGTIHDLYATLCEVSHPATSSLLPFLSYEWDVLVIRPSQEARLISSLVRDHRQALDDLLMISTNTCLVCLKILNKFPLEELHTQYAQKIDLSGVKLWRNVESMIEGGN